MMFFLAGLGIGSVVFLLGSCFGRWQVTRDWHKWEAELTRPAEAHYRRSL